jgi:hypothetical protein
MSQIRLAVPAETLGHVLTVPRPRDVVQPGVEHVLPRLLQPQGKNAWRQLFPLVNHRKQVPQRLPQALAIALITHVGQLR